MNLGKVEEVTLYRFRQRVTSSTFPRNDLAYQASEKSRLGESRRNGPLPFCPSMGVRILFKAKDVPSKSQLKNSPYFLSSCHSHDLLANVRFALG